MNDALPVTRTVDLGTARLLPDLDHPGAWLLTVDDAPQSYVVPGDPTHLEFEYARRLAHVLDTAAEPGHALDLLHLGGGALTLPRYAAAVRPGSRQRVIEADRALAELVEEVLPLPAGGGIRVETADARAALEDSPAGSADVVIADVFGGSRIPARMTTSGCAAAVARVLRPEGIYAANLADGAPFGFLRSQIATVGAVLPQLCLLAEAGVLRGRRFGNVVLAASRGPLPVAALARRAAADPFPARVVHGQALARLAGDAVPVPEAGAAPSPRPPRGAFTVG